MPDPINVSEALSKFRRFYKERGRAPSFHEIAELFGYKSKNAAFELVNKLIAKGFLSKDSKGKIISTALDGAKLLGNIQAGWPSPAEEELVDVLSLDDYLVPSPQQSYLVRVSGDSMIDAGIHEGDLVVAERGRAPKNHDIVIAQVDGEWTMKYYEKNAGIVKLVPANRKYSAIIPQRELVVGAVVTAVIRKYK